MIASSRPPSIACGDLVAEFLADHARGLLPVPLATVAEAHAELSADAARFLAGLDGLAGAALEAAPAGPIGDRDRRLAEIFDRPQRDDVVGPAGRPPLPRAVARLVEDAVEPWRHAWFGIRRRRLGRWGALTAELLEVAGGRTVADHAHSGLEATLVIEGGFRDATGAYTAGDLLILGAEDRHRPRADPEGCLCLAVFEGDGIRPTNGLVRFAAALSTRIAPRRGAADPQ